VGYYRDVRARARENRARHFRDQILVSLVTAALAGTLALLYGQGVTSLIFALGGFAIWTAGADTVYTIRAPKELYDEVADRLTHATVKLDEIAEEQERLSAIDLTFQSVGGAPYPPGHLHPEYMGYMLSLLIYNHGEGANLTASVVDQSVTGVVHVYPMGSFPLRWQLPTTTRQEWIGRGCDARNDVACVVPETRDVWFLAPTFDWAKQHAHGDVVTGLIDFAVVGRDARQRVAFTLYLGPEHPVDLTVEKVDHD
jgi:hypothetical protein